MKKTLMGILILFFLGGLLSSAQSAKFKVFISADMEGISGVVHSDQTSSGGSGYGVARKWMAEDVNAAIEGALAAGADEIVVNDSHGSMRNIIPDDLHRRAVLISGSPKPLVMMQGIDASYQACIFIGYHAKAGTENAILDHTISSSVVRGITVNGTEMPELGINAALAGAYGVPVVLVSGDVAVCKQAKEILGDEVYTVPVKDAIGRTAARLVPLDEARRTIKSRVTSALRERETFEPYRLGSPYTFELEYFTSAQADMGALVPEIKRTGARTLEFTMDDFVQGFKLLRALIALAPAR